MRKTFMTRLLNHASRRLFWASKWFEEPSNRGLAKRKLSIKQVHALNMPWLRAYQFRTVFDIGANIGEFAGTMELMFPGIQIYSFEPLPDCFHQLEERMKHYPHYKAFPVGLAETSGEKTIFLSSSSASSSFRPMGQLHKEAFPYASGSNEVTVKIERLDDVARDLEIKSPTLMKIDVQGFEDQVLKGAPETLKKADVVIIETSFTPLYEGQPLFDDIYGMMRDRGFKFVGIQDSLADPRDGRILQIDGVYEKAR